MPGLSSAVNPGADRVLVVANPNAGARRRGGAVRDLLACLADHGLIADLVSDLSALRPLAERYVAAEQLRAIVAAGGDGTVAEIVNRVDPKVPVTVYPLGTANLLATHFKLGRDPLALAHVLVEGATVRLDAGRANGRIFLLMAGCGFDADVVARLHRKRSGRHISYWTWATPILESIRRYDYADLRLTCEEASGHVRSERVSSARWAFIVNLPCYAAGLRLAPGANGADGVLDICSFSKGSIWHGLKYLAFVAFARHHVLADCQLGRATSVRIESDRRVPYQLDGDPGGMLPLEIEVLPRRFTVMAARERIAALGLQVEMPNATAAEKATV